MPNNNEKQVSSPFELWPGHITLPVVVSPADFHQYLEIVREQEKLEDEHLLNDDRYIFLKAWRARWHIVKDWKLDGVKTADIDETGLKMPATQLIAWVVDEVNTLLREAWRVPKSLAPSNGTTPTTAQETLLPSPGPGITPDGVTTL